MYVMSDYVCKPYSPGGCDTDDVIQTAECAAYGSSQAKPFRYCSCDHRNIYFQFITFTQIMTESWVFHRLPSVYLHVVNWHIFLKCVFVVIVALLAESLLSTRPSEGSLYIVYCSYKEHSSLSWLL